MPTPNATYAPLTAYLCISVSHASRRVSCYATCNSAEGDTIFQLRQLYILTQAPKLAYHILLHFHGTIPRPTTPSLALLIAI
jgi:hypothetical protein